MPARVAGGLSRLSSPPRDAHAPRVHDPRQGARASASRPRRSRSGSAGATLRRRARACAAGRRRCASSTSPRTPASAAGTATSSSTSTACSTAATTPSCSRSATSPTGTTCACRCTTFEDYDELTAALAPRDAIKVATWWNTGAPVWTASVLRGIPVFFVQDIETSYYPDDERMRHARARRAIATSSRYMTISGWNADRLRELGLDVDARAAGHRPRHASARSPRRERRDDMLLALGRTNPLKNLPLTIDAWKALPSRARSCGCSASSPSSARATARATYERPSDEGVNELFNEATVFVQTSTHEGFCLPPLEAMATGARGRLHRRARQPRLLRRRRELPDARADHRRGPRRDRAAARRPRAARAPGRGRPATAAGLRVGAAHRRARGRSRAHETPREQDQLGRPSSRSRRRRARRRPAAISATAEWAERDSG